MKWEERNVIKTFHQKAKRFILFSILIFLSVSFHTGEQRIFVVNSTDDNEDIDLADDFCADKNGSCTLRAAIQNANKTRAKDFIHFDIPGKGPFLIFVTENLPEITETVELDATTQEGYLLNAPQIVLSGEKIITEVPHFFYRPPMTGISLVKRSSGSTVKGFVIGGFGRKNSEMDGIKYPIYRGFGILIKTGQNRIIGNFIGIAADGNSKFSNIWGVGDHSMEKNYIGGKEREERNIISGNYLSGIFIHSNTEISGNFIGTNKFGDCAVANATGIGMIYQSKNNIIKNNLISGNSKKGIEVMGRENYISSNLIGTDNKGKFSVPNGIGIFLDITKKNFIGGNNLISGNKKGIEIFERYIKEPQYNHIFGNFIGTDRSGTYRIPNEIGILMTSGQGNIIGGFYPCQRNVISGNSRSGINLEGTENNVISENHIGTNYTGTKAIPNSTGIEFTQTSAENPRHNLITGNLISGNTGNGISLYKGKFNSLKNNYIGTAKDSLLPLPNRENGVVVYPDSGENCIGGYEPYHANLIAFNNRYGILIKNKKPDHPDGDNRLLHNKVLSNCEADVFIAKPEKALD